MNQTPTINQAPTKDKPYPCTICFNPIWNKPEGLMNQTPTINQAPTKVN
jgi:hypothetical protein